MKSIDRRYKLLVVDIDGTLLDRTGTISAEDKESLARASAAGIRVSLSTGRVVQSALSVINRLSLPGYHMFCDGALVSNPVSGEEVYVDPIDEDTVRQIIEFMHLHEIAIEFHSASRFLIERETWSTELRRQFFLMTPVIVDFANLWQRERIVKGTMVIHSAEERARADSFCHHFKDSLHFSWTKAPAYPEVDFINVLSPGVSKGKALEALASHLGIALTEVVAIGDGANDISLLSKAGLAIAMGDAPDGVKAVADHVTLDVEHSGVAAVIERFLL